jgi:hypothetical protein
MRAAFTWSAGSVTMTSPICAQFREREAGLPEN